MCVVICFLIGTRQSILMYSFLLSLFVALPQYVAHKVVVDLRKVSLQLYNPHGA